MADVVSREVRSRMMAGIRGKNTKPELILRSGLHRLGFRFRVHDRKLPGKPDLVFPKYRAVIFAHGCFWHRHGCHLFKWPRSRAAFWREKLSRNAKVDQRNLAALKNTGWRIGIAWECALKGRTKEDQIKVIAQFSRWLTSQQPFLEVLGRKR